MPGAGKALKSRLLLRVGALAQRGKGCNHGVGRGWGAAAGVLASALGARRGQATGTLMLKMRMVTMPSAMYGAYYMPGTVRGALHILTQFSQPPYEVDLVIFVLKMRQLRYTEIR